MIKKKDDELKIWLQSLYIAFVIFLGCFFINLIEKLVNNESSLVIINKKIFLWLIPLETLFIYSIKKMRRDYYREKNKDSEASSMESRASEENQASKESQASDES